MINTKAYTEVYYIINEMSDELRSKIPDSVIQNIKDKMDPNYEFNKNCEDIELVELLDDTEKILSVLYTDYFATEEERKVILAKEKSIIREKYKNNNIKTNLFEKNIVVNNVSISEQNKNNWYLKIINYLKKIKEKIWR